MSVGRADILSFIRVNLPTAISQTRLWLNCLWIGWGYYGFRFRSLGFDSSNDQRLLVGL